MRSIGRIDILSIYFNATLTLKNSICYIFASPNKNIHLKNEQQTFLENERSTKRHSVIPFVSVETDSESEQLLEGNIMSFYFGDILHNFLSNFFVKLSKSISNVTISNESRTDSFNSLQRIPSNFEAELPMTSKERKLNLMTLFVSAALD